MKNSKHIESRMKERHIHNETLEFISYFVDFKNGGNKKILKPKEIRGYVKKMNFVIKKLQEAERKGGITLVEKEDTRITTYYKKEIK